MPPECSRYTDIQTKANMRINFHKTRLFSVALGVTLLLWICLVSLRHNSTQWNHEGASLDTKQIHGNWAGEPTSNRGLIVKLWPNDRQGALINAPHPGQPRSQKEHLEGAAEPEQTYPISDDVIACGDQNTECNRFRALLDNWPPGKPKAAFYFLTQASRLSRLRKALESVDKYFNNKYRYPIIVFHEDDLLPHLGVIRTFTSSDMYFQHIRFTLPEFLTQPVVFDIPCTSRIGYRHMCRFHAKGVFQQPIMRGLEYYWRLDDDSLLLSKVQYDVFKFMQDRKLNYGYSWIHFDNHKCTLGLWEATRNFINKTGLKTEFFHEWRNPQLYYNNFEISDMSIWLSKEYANYIEYIDQLGGIFYHRWGDAPIKGIAVSLFVPKNTVHHFKDIGYQHGSYVHLPKNTTVTRKNIT